jgi:hypothetical protein
MLVAESFDVQDSVISFTLNLDLIKRMQQSKKFLRGGEQ